MTESATGITEHRFKMECTTTTPLLTSNGRGSQSSDIAFRRRLDGTCVIPGSSLAGVLRGVVESMTGTTAKCVLATGGSASPGSAEPCQCKCCELFGNVRPVTRDANAATNRAVARCSKLTFHDAQIEQPSVRVVDNVSIDRTRRSAADHRLFSHEEVAPGARFLIVVEGRDLTAEEIDTLKKALAEIGRGGVGIGARTAQGLGRVEATLITVRARNSRNANALIAACLHGDDSDTAWTETQAVEFHEQQPSRWPSIEFALKSTDQTTLLVNDPTESVRTGYDSAPRGGDRPELPGTSFRGVLRSHCERILRTLNESAACDPTGAGACSRTLPDAQPAELCFACRVFGNENYASCVRVCVTRLDGPRSRAIPIDYVAIDRFTGGAADGKKFNARLAMGQHFKVRIEVAASRGSDNDVTEPAFGLLALFARDLMDKRVAFGAASSRGNGVFDVTPCVVRGVPDGSRTDAEPPARSLNQCQPFVDALWQLIQRPTSPSVAGSTNSGERR